MFDMDELKFTLVLSNNSLGHFQQLYCLLLLSFKYAFLTAETFQQIKDIAVKN